MQDAEDAVDAVLTYKSLVLQRQATSPAGM